MLDDPLRRLVFVGSSPTADSSAPLYDQAIRGELPEMLTLEMIGGLATASMGTPNGDYHPAREIAARLWDFKRRGHLDTIEHEGKTYATPAALRAVLAHIGPFGDGLKVWMEDYSAALEPAPEQAAQQVERTTPRKSLLKEDRDRNVALIIDAIICGANDRATLSRFSIPIWREVLVKVEPSLGEIGNRTIHNSISAHLDRVGIPRTDGRKSENDNAADPAEQLLRYYKEGARQDATFKAISVTNRK